MMESDQNVRNLRPKKQKQTRTTSTERSRKRRAKIKCDTEKHKLEKEKDRMRKKLQRQKLREKAKDNKVLLSEIRAKKKDEMAKYRAKKRAEKQSNTMVSDKDKNRTKTASALANRLLDKEKKANAVLRTKEWRMRVKLKERDSPNSAQTLTRDAEKRNDKPYVSRTSEHRALKRAKGSLPHTPVKRARILEKLTNSPRVRNELIKRKVVTTPHVEEMSHIGEMFVETVKDMNNNIESKPTNSSEMKEKRHARKTLKYLLKNTGKPIKRVKKIQRITGLHTKGNISSWWKNTVRKARNGHINQVVKKTVDEFYTSGEVSRCVPNKKDVRGGQPMYVMTMTIKDAHYAFQKKYPNTKVGLTTFYKMKPKFVKKVSETNRKCCLCQVCCNCALIADALNNFCGKAEGYSKVNKTELAAIMTCKEQSAMCLGGQCEKCGYKNIKDHFKEHEENNGGETIKYHRWETINIETKDGNTKRCVSCVPKEETFREFLTSAESTLRPLPGHLFRAKWQLNELEKCKQSINGTEAVVIMDFAENYGCRFQNEVQSAFWDTNQVTIHPMMSYYKNKDGEEELVKKHAVIGISNDQRHDAHAVQKFREHLYSKIKDNNPNIKTVYEWTDGAACQYKGKVSFADISMENRFKVQRNFFETSHGKNVCDGLGATVKNSCHQAVISGRRVIGNAMDVYKYCEERLAQDKNDTKREFVYIDTKDVVRDRPSGEACTVVGTRKLHNVRSTGKPYHIQIRNLSCFCHGCRENDICESTEYVDKWEDRIIKQKCGNDASALKKLGRKTKRQSAVPSDCSPSATNAKKSTAAKAKKSTAAKAKKSTAAKVKKSSATKVKKSSATEDKRSCATKAKRSCAVNAGIGLDSAETQTEISIGDIQQNQYVSVRLAGAPQKSYIAQVLEVDENTEEVRLTFMASKAGMYMWPDTPDLSWESINAIEQLLPDPTLSTKSTNRRNYFVFNK